MKVKGEKYKHDIFFWVTSMINNEMKWNMKIIVSKFWPLILFHHKEVVGFHMLEVKCAIEFFSHFNQVDVIIY
jgi:hypothetical protein